MKHRPKREITRAYSPRLDCENKRAFATEAEAQAAAEHQMFQYMELDLEVYQCHICGHWHLTRQARDHE